MAHFRMSACLTRPVRLVRERELGDLGVVARPRERTQAGGRPTCGMTLRIKLYRDDRGPSQDVVGVVLRGVRVGHVREMQLKSRHEKYGLARCI